MSLARGRPKRKSKTLPNPKNLLPYVQLVDCFANDPGPSSSPLEPKQEIQLNKMVDEFVYYVLIADQKKHAIKKSDIIKHVLKDNSRLFRTVKDSANLKLEKVFGFKLVQVLDRKDQFILINQHKVVVTEFSGETPLLQRGLLFFVLTLIFMNDTASISEEELWEILEKMDIDVTSNKPNKTFGDAKKYLTQELVKQMYLEYRQIPGSNPPKYEFIWGFRSYKEVDTAEILNFVCEIYGTEPQNWVIQHRAIQLSKQDADQEV